MALLALWVAGLLAYQLPGPGWLSAAVAALWLALAGFTAWRVARGRSPRRWTAPVTACLGLAGLGWLLLTPRQDRDWADDVAQRLHVASFDGRHVVLDNVRDFTWRSETDYDARWVQRRYDLDQLRSADLVLSYWMGPAIAHTLVSFGFDDGRYLVFSLEIRKERGEAFSAIGGFFRRFEMTLVASEETDILRTRTNARGEDVYLYRLHGMDRAQLKTLFAAYLDEARKLDEKPAFYNTLTSNCTTIVFDLARHIAPGLPLDYRLLLSGYLAEYAQQVGALTPGVPFNELHAKGRITQRALQMAPGQDFSRVIRQGVPGTGQDEQP
ncbi:DUF4105 domain-containing protein [Stenotrophomonas sp. YAU14D1_LEIMI4_1]|uniref:Lnb N-terminal periplasmic domain-containing protein n=1 Tax=Stenotrophomonas sp. YAU14D1_LEIMI4_1 TaxID=2072407 RepID=UPI000D53D96C|nr:DUF4105 domain-containing protein [Stenotrophomonas sp. YAU14D1_LEIMI4_1]AWH24489.1 hypothetical protein C1932_04900 [Stenotrophomonas sp. YAU14D1_LEIMI4_1]